MVADEAKALDGIFADLVAGNTKHARSELLRLKRDEECGGIRDTVNKLLALTSRHSCAVILTSAFVTILLSIFAAALLAPLQILVTKGAPHNEGDMLSYFGWLLAVAFSGCTYKGIQFAREKHPSFVRPAVSWIFMIPAVVALASALMVIYDVASVISFLAIGKYQISLEAVRLTLEKYWGTDSPLGAALIAAGKHPLLWLSVVVTGILNYHGAVGKKTSMAIEFINDVMEP